jgi:hypothetical protein
LSSVADVPDKTLETSRAFTKTGVKVEFGVDGTRLNQKLPSGFFETVVFQFPDAGSRASADKFTANHQLICHFLKSADKVLALNGQFIITILGTTCNYGVFDLKRAADLSSFEVECAQPFYRSHFEGCNHSNTWLTDSALQAYRSCTTYVFGRPPR